MVTESGRTNMYTEEERASEETLKEEMKLNATRLNSHVPCHFARKNSKRC